jgi:hypothetical protein
MRPELLYWIALAVLVVPSIPFNRVAAIVALAWAFGHFVHGFTAYEDAAYMASRIVAFGAALALSKPWCTNLKTTAKFITAILFIPAAVMAGVSACLPTQAETMEQYHLQTALYWTTWAVIMAQAVSVPFGNDWTLIVRVARKIDDWLMARIVRHFGDAL